MRYAAFGGYDYEACGGWSDLIIHTDNLEEAIERAKASYQPEATTIFTSSWWEVIDLENGEEKASYRRG